MITALLAVWALLGPQAQATGGFPPVAYIARELNLTVGQPLPKGVIWNGRPYYFYIVSARELPNGHYAVVLGTK